MSILQHPSHSMPTLEQVLCPEAREHDEEQWLGYEGMHPMTWLPAPGPEATGTALQ